MTFTNFAFDLLLNLPALLSVFVINGYIMAYTATKLGDPTPRIKGRLSLSPKAHIDFIGFLFLLATGFGWGPCMDINPRYFKNPRRDSVITVLAGSLGNFVLAFFACLLRRILLGFPLNVFWDPLLEILRLIMLSNILLGLFFLLPIPPLNGFLILEKLLPVKYFRLIQFLQNYGFIVLIFLMLSRISCIIINPFFQVITIFIQGTVNFLFNVFKAS
ncbi:MAG: site-2 protease family protein [Clostridiales bacterium]|nr:site-2 protease family protein [Clostridiales bacterium]